MDGSRTDGVIMQQDPQDSCSTMDGSSTDGVMMQQDLQDSSSEEDVLTDKYTILKTLGTGGFADVKLALHCLTEVPVALKMLRKDETNSCDIQVEVAAMKFVNHPNIIKLFHVMETTDHIYLVLEYASGGDLANYILEVDHIPEVEVRRIFTQLTCAVKYCHENDIAHRDIKPENILMDAMKNVKLCDFGLAFCVCGMPESRVFCGTLPYCAPELFRNQAYDPLAVDIWSMGVVLYRMLTKHYPFFATTYDEMKIIMRKPRCFISPKLPVHIVSLITAMFTTDPRQRPKIQDIMQYQWLKGSEEFSKPTLSLEPLSNSIIAAMEDMGYSSEDIIDSLEENDFDSVMETYLILKYQSPCMDNSNHKEKSSTAMALADPPTCHSYLKSIGSEPDNSTSTENYPSQDNKIVKKETKNHSMPSIHCCQQKSQPHSTGVHRGPLQHDYEHILSSSLQKSVSCGPFQHCHEYIVSNRASKSVPCGPFQHRHEYIVSNRASKSVPCGPFQHRHEDIVSNRASKSVPCGPFQHRHEDIVSNRASKSVPCGPFQHRHEYIVSNRASKSVPCGPFQHRHEDIVSNRASKSVPCGPFQHRHEYIVSNRASKSVPCGPFQHRHEDIVSNRASKTVPCGPFQHRHEDIVSNRASKSVPCGPFQHRHEYIVSNRASKSVPCGPFQHRHEYIVSNRASKSVPCCPFQHCHEYIVSNRASKSVLHNKDKHLDILSEIHITLVQAQDENPHKSSSFPQHTPSSRSSKEGFEDVTTTDAHQDKSLTPQEITEPNCTSAQPQSVTTASPRRWGGWKQVKRRLVKGLRRLCCCLPPEEDSSTSKKMVKGLRRLCCCLPPEEDSSTSKKMVNPPSS